MLLQIRRRVTYANIAMTLAVVFAMAGGAFAASTHKKHHKQAVVITSTRQISKSVLAALKGNVGPTGSAGKDGAPGLPGKDGAPGLPGKDGVGVTSVAFTGTEEPEGEPCAGRGGSAFTSTSGKTYACDGETGFTETVPVGEDETGTWTIRGVDNAAEEFKPSNISFAIPLKTALTSSEFHYIPSGASVPSGCAGNVEKPEASKGNLCLFEGETFFHKGSFSAVAVFTLKKGFGVETTGAVIAGETKAPATPGEEVSVEGSWAVGGN